MYEVAIKNCNSIKDGIIHIQKNKLNIKYGINGTGKTTIAKAIKFAGNDEKLQELKSYFAVDSAEVVVSPAIEKKLVFDEDFVNNVVFKEDEVIENSFEVFLKTPNYDEKKEALDRRLESLHKIMEDDEDIVQLKKKIDEIRGRFTTTNNGLKRVGTYKSLLTKTNLYNIPTELKPYEEFIENKDININWIDWKNKGDEYDIGEKCPYCTENIHRVDHNKRKEVFKKTYSKTDSKNLKEVLELFEMLKEYLDPEKYKSIISCVKDNNDEDVIELIIRGFVSELDLMIARFNAILDFGKRKIVLTEISELGTQLSGMKFPVEIFNYFKGEKIVGIFERVNTKVSASEEELTAIKKDMGILKGLMMATIEKSQKDINEFLKTAGICYELVIEAEDESNSRTILRQCFSDEKSTVTKIRNHLSWGEKNAFSLILFMYYANTQNPDLIILDDPISSFDINKKYAILHRMFKNIGKDVSFLNKTVLLLTHDFEPINDFLVVGKLNSDQAVASFIWNKDRIVAERTIDPQSNIKLVLEECEMIARNQDINYVSRTAFLRKLCELNSCKGSWGHAYEILSCLIHGSEIKCKIGHNKYEDMDPADVESGMCKIKEFMPEFDYDNLKENTYTVNGIKTLYENEENPYLKIQLFRGLKEIANPKDLEIGALDAGWYKFIDETYHIENDYLHYLDILEFNIVPDYILKMVDGMMAELK